MASPIDSSQVAAKRKSLRSKRKSKIEVLGVKIPARPWVVTCFTTLLILGALGSLALKLIIPMIEEREALSKLTVAKSNQLATNARVAQEKQEKERDPFQEYQKHFSETPVRQDKVFDNPQEGSVSIATYSSDGCLLVKRKTPGGKEERPYWILSDSNQYEKSPGNVDGGRLSLSFLEGRGGGRQASSSESLLSGLTVVAEAAEQQGCSGRCVDPHPGPFQSWNGQQNGCWIQVWRKWPEGCQHYQWYNSCNGAWDSYPNGAPKVFWTCCVH